MTACTLDHPLTRNHVVCPLCGDAKDTGLLTCWPCYRRFNLKYGNPQAEAAIERMEQAWERNT